MVTLTVVVPRILFGFFFNTRLIPVDVCFVARPSNGIARVGTIASIPKREHF
jgi:hypothetical protein